jgi:hypothetical protein
VPGSGEHPTAPSCPLLCCLPILGCASSDHPHSLQQHLPILPPLLDYVGGIRSVPPVTCGCSSASRLLVLCTPAHARLVLLLGVTTGGCLVLPVYSPPVHPRDWTCSSFPMFGRILSSLRASPVRYLGDLPSTRCGSCDREDFVLE